MISVFLSLQISEVLFMSLCSTRHFLYILLKMPCITLQENCSSWNWSLCLSGIKKSLPRQNRCLTWRGCSASHQAELFHYAANNFCWFIEAVTEDLWQQGLTPSRDFHVPCFYLFTVPMGEVLFCFPSGQCQAFLLYSRIEWSENKIISNALVMPPLGRY